MDCGIPTEETLGEVAARLTGELPRWHALGQLNAEKDFARQTLSQAKEAVRDDFLEQDGEVYLLAKSEGRVLKERAMRRKKLKKFLGAASRNSSSRRGRATRRLS